MLRVFGVIIPVGPGDREIARLHQLLAELSTYEDRRRVPRDRRRRPRAPVDRGGLAGPQVFRTEARQRGGVLDPYGAMVASTIEGLRICRERRVDMVLKLDTDAAVIGPSPQRSEPRFGMPRLGVVGSYDVTSAGGRRDWSVWASRLRRADLPLHLVRAPHGRASLRFKSRADRNAVRRLLDAARQHAPEGAHCLGGAYAVSRALLDSAELDSGPMAGYRAERRCRCGRPVLGCRAAACAASSAAISRSRSRGAACRRVRPSWRAGAIASSTRSRPRRWRPKVRFEPRSAPPPAELP